MGSGMKSCTLSGPIAGPLQIQGQVDHGRQVAAGMAGHEIGDQVLLLAGRGRRLAETPARRRRKSSMGGLFICRSVSGSACSGATFSSPPV